MRLSSLFLLLIGFSQIYLTAQSHFPIKVDGKWGLINTSGHISLRPQYDAIGEFKAFGYAIMQRANRVGLLNEAGEEVLTARYDDIKVLDSLLIAVMKEGAWEVVNLRGETILEKGYERVKVIGNGFLSYRLEEKWGLLNRHGEEILSPRFDDILIESDRYFLVRLMDKLGLIDHQGQTIVPPTADEIRLYNDQLVFFKQDRYWGAMNELGQQELEPIYHSFEKLGNNFIKLRKREGPLIYSLSCGRVMEGIKYADYISFSNQYISVLKNQKLGLIDACGREVLAVRYQEIQPYSTGKFRANLAGSWGVVAAGDQVVIPFAYQYIAPPRGPVSLMKQAHRLGVVNVQGDVIAPAAFDRLDIEGDRVKAYTEKGNGESAALSVFRFDAEGVLTEGEQFAQHFEVRVRGKDELPATNEDPSTYVLDHFEWFYVPEEDRWGLRRLSDGNIEIPPQFHDVQVDKQLGISLVGIHTQNAYDFDRTTFRFEMIYGLVLNDVGKPVTDIDFLDVRLSDFRAGYPTARVVFSNGKHGLVDRSGLIVRRDLAYIGSFRDGAARMSMSGRLSGSLKDRFALDKLTDYLQQLRAPSAMVDYTQFDQLFQKDAYLTCENCQWGFIDSTGTVIAPPKYAYVKDFVNDAAIVYRDEKWGLVNKSGKEVVPCQYDDVSYLPNTRQQVVKVYVAQPKYGLIDTLGNLAISAIYDEIGEFQDGLLAVSQNGRWGFVDAEGREVIHCEYQEVRSFSEGLAAVRQDRSWGFIDKNGEIVIDYQYRRVGNFSNGISWVYNDVGTGYIDRKNRWVIEPRFDRAFDFYQGVARVVKDNKWGLIDGEGQYVQKPKYTEIGLFNDLGLATVRYGDSRVRYGVINLRGQLITSGDFRAISEFSEGMAAVKGKNSWGYINIYGDLSVPMRFGKAGPFREGRAMVQINGQCGYIDRSGDIVIPCQYSRCQDFSEGRAVVYRGLRRAGIIDQDGEQIIGPSLDRLLTFREGRGLMRDEQYRFYYITEQSGLYNGYYDNAMAFQHGVAVVQIDGKWGIINQRGIEIIPPKYDKIEHFENGYAKVKIEGYNGLRSLSGEVIAPPKYEFIAYAGNGLFRVEQGDKLGYFDTQGKWVWELQE